MYSLVLAAMLTTGTTTPAWGCHGGLFHGCHACHGAWGCYGGCYSCYSCLGCYGGYGSCYGGWGGCYGSCYSGWGCWGGYGCYGSCYGGWGGYGCYGGCFGCYGSCSGGWGCYGGGYGGYVEPAAPVMPGAPSSAPTSKEPIKAPAPAKESALPGRAHILVQLPKDAKLFVDDHPVTLPPNQRTVVTPELEPGQDYYYIFRAEAVRNGTPVEDSRRVVIRAGARVTVNFGDLATTKAKETPNRVTAQK